MSLAVNPPLKGLHPVGNGVAGTTPRVREYDVSSSYATAMGEGCVVIKTATGLQLAGATVSDGTAVGVLAQNIAASTGGKVLVYDDPSQEFEVLIDGSITNAATLISWVGRYAKHLTNTYNGKLKQGNTYVSKTGISGTPTTTLYLQILGGVDHVGNDATLVNSTIRVKFNNQSHFYSSQAGTDVRP